MLSRNEEVQNLARTTATIHAMTLCFGRAETKPGANPRLKQWRKPLTGQLLLNVDASLKG